MRKVAVFFFVVIIFAYASGYAQQLPDAVGAEIVKLRSGTPQERKDAALALRGEDSKDAVSALIEALQDKDSSVSYAAIEALGISLDPRASDALWEYLKASEADVNIQYAIAQALGKTSDPRILANARIFIKDPAKKAAGLFLLQEFDDPAVIDVLIGALSDDNESFRESVAEAITAKGRMAGAQDKLIGALKDANPQVRFYSAGILGQVQSQRATPPLITLLKDENVKVRYMAVWALGNLHDPRAIEPLIESLRDRDPEVRGKVALVLGSSGDTRAVEPLIACAKDKDDYVRSSVIGALQLSADPRAEKTFRAAVFDGNEAVRANAARGLKALQEAGEAKP